MNLIKFVLFIFIINFSFLFAREMLPEDVGKTQEEQKKNYSDIVVKWIEEIEKKAGFASVDLDLQKLEKDIESHQLGLLINNFRTKEEIEWLKSRGKMNERETLSKLGEIIKLSSINNFLFAPIAIAANCSIESPQEKQNVELGVKSVEKIYKDKNLKWKAPKTGEDLFQIRIRDGKNMSGLTQTIIEIRPANKAKDNDTSNYLKAFEFLNGAQFLSKETKDKINETIIKSAHGDPKIGGIYLTKEQLDEFKKIIQQLTGQKD